MSFPSSITLGPRLNAPEIAGTEMVVLIRSLCADPETFFLRRKAKRLDAIDPDLVTCDTKFVITAYPEVADDLRELHQYGLPDHPEHATALYSRLKQFVANAHKQPTRTNPHPLLAKKHDFTGLRSHELDVQKAPKGALRKPYRVVFHDVGHQAQPTGICIVAIGEKIAKADRVYGIKVAPRTGRDPDVADSTGLELQIQLALDADSRGRFRAEFHLDHQEGASSDSAVSGLYWPAWLVTHETPAPDSAPSSFTDWIGINFDNRSGRAALWAMASLLAWTVDNNVPTQVDLG